MLIFQTGVKNRGKVYLYNIKEGLKVKIMIIMLELKVNKVCLDKKYKK